MKKLPKTKRVKLSTYLDLYEESHFGELQSLMNKTIDELIEYSPFTDMMRPDWFSYIESNYYIEVDGWGCALYQIYMDHIGKGLFTFSHTSLTTP